MRRFQEMLREANGPDRIAKLDELRAKKLEPRIRYSQALGAELGAVANENLVVKRGDASDARAEARHITEEHQSVDKDQLAAH